MKQKTGVWFIGACGNIATLVQAGILLLKAGKADSAGILTETNLFKNIPVLPYGDILFGGCDIKKPDFTAAIGYLADFIPAVRDNAGFINAGLKKNLKNIVPGITGTKTDIDSVRNVRNKIKSFAESNGLECVIVVNTASTEPLPGEKTARMSLRDLETAVFSGRKSGLPVSSLYAYAALSGKFPYINFTPSAGSSLPAFMELAVRERIPHMGRDGKTGETLMKSVLAAMFLMRNLKVKNWAGYNILGTEDGRNLDAPRNKAAKIATKQGILKRVLGYEPDTKVGIDYLPSLGGWKIAWDYIQFSGFLETEMSLQFVWQGRDTALAAPLVIDLIRLVHLAYRRGEYGTLPHLSLFFKSPDGCNTDALPEQFELLRKYLISAQSDR